MGAGLELTVIPFLPLRAGAALISGGWQAAAGAGLKLGPFELSAGAMLRTRDSGSEYGAMVNVFSIH